MPDTNQLLSVSPITSPQGHVRMNPWVVFRMRCTAWMVRCAARSELAMLDARRRVAESRRVAEELEADVHLGRELRNVLRDEAQGILETEVRIEGLLLEREQIRSQRPVRELVALAADATPPQAAMEQDLGDREIEALAVRAVTRFGTLSGVEAERAWTEWRRELVQRFPPYVAAEVARRVQELHSLTR